MFLKINNNIKILQEWEKNFYYIGVSSKMLCSEKISSAVIQNLKSSFDSDFTTSQHMFYNYFAQKYLDPSVLTDARKKKLATNLQSILKKDDSLASMGYGFNIASELGELGTFIHEKVEDVLAQADEVDGKMLQFDGGLSVTSLIINGILKIPSSSKSSKVDKVQATKFASYFLSRRSVTTPKGASYLLESLKMIMEQKNISPIAIQLTENGVVSSQNPNLKVSISSLFGETLSEKPGSVKVLLFSPKDKLKAVLEELATPSANDQKIYSLNLKNRKIPKGLYIVDVQAGAFKQSGLSAKVLGEVKLDNVDVSISEAESQSPSKQYTLSKDKELAELNTLDHQQKIVLRFDLLDSQTNSVTDVHQCFIRFTDKSGAEIVFVAEQDMAKAYKFELDVGARATDFGGRSGVYSIDVVVGDSSISNSFIRRIGNVNFKFTYDSRKDPVDSTKYKAKSEIHHLFREPEKRPPKFVSDLFTVLCFLPLVILFAMWLKIGLRLSNFYFSLSSIGFHTGLGLIFSLFLCFWLKLNMFQTIKYLIPLATFTFLTGNRVLRHIANKRLEKL